MEEDAALDGCFEREFYDVIDAAVAPAAVLLVFFAIVLGVHDEDVHVFDELGDPSIFVAGVFEFGGVTAATELGIVAMTEMRFVVRKKGNRAANGEQAIADTNAGMIGHAG